MYQGKALWLISCRVFGVDYPQLLASKSLGVGPAWNFTWKFTWNFTWKLFNGLWFICKGIYMKVVIPTGNIYIH